MVGIAVGSVAALLLMLLLLWWWRRRAARKRGDTLPSAFSTARRDRRGSHANDIQGVEADTKNGLARLAAALGFHGGRSRSPSGATDSPEVNLNRGPSQFLETATVPGREKLPGVRPVSDIRAVKDRLLDWWSRKPEDENYNNSLPVNRGRPVAGNVAENTSTYNARSGSRPGLGINFEGSGSFDPFSDAQAISEKAVNSTRPTAPANPFADPSITQPARHSRSLSHNQRASVAYTPAIPPRSRGRSLSTNVRASGNPPPLPASRPHSVQRESLQSVDSFVDRRNKFRSDPFDLEIESRMMASSATAVAQMPRYTARGSAYSSHTRQVSLSSSRYTSGVSVSGWSDAGADRGEEAAPNAAALGRESDSPTLADASRPGRTTPPIEGKKDGKVDVLVGRAL